MCTPDAYYVFQAVNAVNDYNNARTTAKNINQTAENTAQRIRNEAVYADNALIRKTAREEEKLSQQKFTTMVKARRTAAEAKVGIGEKGIGGSVVDTLLGDIDRARGIAFSTIDTNYENYMTAVTDQRMSTNRTYANQILGLPRSATPSFLPFAAKAVSNSVAFAYSIKAPDVKPVGQTSGYTPQGINLDALYSGLD